MSTKHLLALLGVLGTVSCLRPPLSKEFEEANPSSQEGWKRPLVPDLPNNPIDQILEEIAQLKEENMWLNDNIIQLTEMIQNFAVAPIGTISAWVTKPTKETREEEVVNLPEGWVRCNGDTIPEPSMWAGQLTPNLNGEKRFLRGAPDSEMLKMEEDQMQDHKHKVSDPGHSHSYVDHWNHGSWSQGDPGDHRLDQPQDKTTGSKHTGITVQGVSSGFRSGSETRPKNMNVIFIMRVW